MSAPASALGRTAPLREAPEASRAAWEDSGALEARNSELWGPLGAEMATNEARDFAQSHFRRRNRLESRLEELQKDVAKLTMKLRSGSARGSVADASVDRTPEREVEIVEKRATPVKSGKKARFIVQEGWEKGESSHGVEFFCCCCICSR